MTTRLTKISIITLTLLLCALLFFVFFDNSKRHEWFSVGVLFYYAIGLTLLYLGLLTTIGLIVKRFVNPQTGKTMLRTTAISLILLSRTLTATFIKNSYDFKQWKEKSDQTLKKEKLLEQDLVQNQLDSLDKIIADFPDNCSALVKRGLLKRKNGKLEESISDYELALKVKPDDFTANLEMGYSLGLLDRKEEAEKYYRIAANRDTSSYFAKTNRHYIDNEKETAGNTRLAQWPVTWISQVRCFYMAFG